MHDGQTENSKRHPPINLKEPERELTVPQEWGNPSLLFLPLFPHAADPAQAPTGIYRSPNSEGGKSYSPLEGAEAPRGWTISQCFTSSLCPHDTWLNCRHSHTRGCHCRVTKAPASWPNSGRKGSQELQNQGAHGGGGAWESENSKSSVRTDTEIIAYPQKLVITCTQKINQSIAL